MPAEDIRRGLEKLVEAMLPLTGALVAFILMIVIL
jgi:hypothetical protein